MRFDFRTNRIVIDGVETLAKASTLLHDAVFRSSDIVVNTHKREFRMRLWREVPECWRARRVCVVLSRIEVLRAECELYFCDVVDATIAIQDHLEYYSLFGIRPDRQRSRLRFLTESSITLALSIDQVSGTVADTGKTTWNQFGYSTIGVGREARKRK